ncbi:MAG: histidine phosphatase family protein [Bacteroidota bacterium]
MSKHLYLLRHAQTKEKQTGQSDFDRELTSIGLQNANRMGINFSNKNIQPDIIISSQAKRAKTTSKIIAEQIRYNPDKIHFNEEIYNASIRTLLQVVNQMKDEWNSVILVGHNPAITYLAEYLTNEEIGDMSTCGFVVIEFPFDEWQLVSEGNGNFITYEYPDLLNF